MLIDIDGVRHDTFAQAYETGRLPNLSRILSTGLPAEEAPGSGSAFWFTQAATVFPSVTMAAQASLFTGVFPGRHGIAGNQWFDRDQARFIDYMGLYGTPCVYGFTLVLGADCRGGWANYHLLSPTLYEAASKAGKTSVVVYNEYWRGATRVLIPSPLEALAFVQGSPGDFEAFDRSMMDRALEDAAAHGLPDILTLYFIGADEIGHQQGVAGQFGYLERVIDPELGRLFDALEAADPDWRADTLFVISSDHGRTDTTYSAEDAMAPSGVRAALRRAGYDDSRFQIALNGGMAHIYLGGLDSGRPWDKSPSLDEKLAVARELYCDETLRPVVEMVAVRAAAPDTGYRIYGETAAGSAEWMPVAVSVARLLDALESPRTGDLLVILRSGHYFGGQPGSQHGGIHETDLSIPLVLAGAGVLPGQSDAPVSNTQIAATVAGFLEFAVEGMEPALPNVWAGHDRWCPSPAFPYTHWGRCGRLERVR